MNITLNLQKLVISDRYRQRIIDKFNNGLEKLLQHYPEDLKKALISIEKVTRSGYIIKFDMNLPGSPINVTETNKVLMDGIVDVKNKAKRQIKKNLEKIRGH